MWKLRFFGGSCLSWHPLKARMHSNCAMACPLKAHMLAVNILTQPLCRKPFVLAANRSASGPQQALEAMHAVYMHEKLLLDNLGLHER